MYFKKNFAITHTNKIINDIYGPTLSSNYIQLSMAVLSWNPDLFISIVSGMNYNNRTYSISFNLVDKVAEKKFAEDSHLSLRLHLRASWGRHSIYIAFPSHWVIVTHVKGVGEKYIWRNQSINVGGCLQSDKGPRNYVQEEWVKKWEV